MSRFELTLLALLGALLLFPPQLPAMDGPPQVVQLTLTTPDPAWRLEFVKAVRTGDEIWVHSRLRRPEGVMAPQIISQAQYTVHLKTKPATTRHWVTGKTWNWDPPEPATFVDDETDLPEALRTGQPLPVATQPPAHQAPSRD